MLGECADQSEYRIGSVKRKRYSHYKEIASSDGLFKLNLPLSACVRQGDCVNTSLGYVYVKCKNGQVQIFPSYCQRDKVDRDGLFIEFLVKEITEKEEYEAYKALTDYHYRKRSIYGRTAVLVMRCFDLNFPNILGYIEIATPLYMNKARSKIFDSPFRCDNIAWEHWDMDTARKNINILARVSRCVVYPEFRGLGLGQLLIKHAINYVQNHWQVGGLRPYFLEISADMIKYVPFAEKAGMTYIGDTEGNLNRVSKDIKYLLDNYSRIKSKEIVQKGSFGIVDQQVARLNRAVSIIESNGLAAADIIKRLDNLSKASVLRDYSLFHEIVSLPKPNFMIGLNSVAQCFLEERLQEIQPKRDKLLTPFIVEKLNHPISLSNVNISYCSQVRRTKRTHTVQQAFGISPDEIKSEIIHNLSINIDPGEVILIVGPSGSGKTTLLGYLSNPNEELFSGKIEGSVCFPSNYNSKMFSAPRSSKPSIELFNSLPVPSALYLMSLVGLSDAFVYLKRFQELSTGQQYRIMLGLLIASKSNVWIIDEFCTNLDLISAKAVAGKLQRLARKFGVTLIVAAPYCFHIIHALKPDKVVQLRSTWEIEVHTKDDVSDLAEHNYCRASKVPVLKFSEQFFNNILEKNKRTTIRKGRKGIKKGPLLLESKGKSVLVYVTDIAYKKFNKLTEEDAIRDGFESLESLKDTIRKIYPNIGERSNISVIYFKLPLQTD